MAFDMAFGWVLVKSADRIRENRFGIAWKITCRENKNKHMNCTNEESGLWRKVLPKGRLTSEVDNIGVQWRNERCFTLRRLLGWKPWDWMNRRWSSTCLRRWQKAWARVVQCSAGADDNSKRTVSHDWLAEVRKKKKTACGWVAFHEATHVGRADLVKLSEAQVCKSKDFCEKNANKQEHLLTPSWLPTPRGLDQVPKHINVTNKSYSFYACGSFSSCDSGCHLYCQQSSWNSSISMCFSSDFNDTVSSVCACAWVFFVLSVLCLADCHREHKMAMESQDQKLKSKHREQDV